MVSDPDHGFERKMAGIILPDCPYASSKAGLYVTYRKSTLGFSGPWIMDLLIETFNPFSLKASSVSIAAEGFSP